MKVTYEMTERDFSDYLRWWQSKRTHRYKTHTSSYLLGAAMCVGIGLVAVNDSDPVHFTSLGFLIGGVFVYAVCYWYSKTAYADYRPSKNSHFLGPHTIESNDTGVRITSPQHDATYFWSLVSGVELSEHHLFIPVDRLSAITIPNRAFASQQQKIEFITEVRTHAKRTEPY